MDVQCVAQHQIFVTSGLNCRLGSDLLGGGGVLWHQRWKRGTNSTQIAHNLVWICSISSFGSAVNLKAECRQVTKILQFHLAAL